jgi:DNA-directed RNA polymerase subunit RPC12/RpoP
MADKLYHCARCQYGLIDPELLWRVRIAKGQNIKEFYLCQDCMRKEFLECPEVQKFIKTKEV